MPNSVEDFQHDACTTSSIEMSWTELSIADPNHQYQVKQGAGVFSTQSSPYNATGLNPSTNYTFAVEVFFTCGTPGPGDKMESVEVSDVFFTSQSRSHAAAASFKYTFKPCFH